MAFAVAAIGLAALDVGAQQTRATDAHLYPFIGCWRADSTAQSGVSGALSCVVPVAGSADVEIVSLADGRIAERRRIDASGRPRAIDEQGCSGQEQASWSPEPRRVYLHSAFTCAPNGIAGGKTTLMSILPSGEWLEVESVRAGSGAITHVERRRDAGIPATVPRDIATRVGTRRLAVMTARAGAATPLRTTDVLEALHHSDSAVVRAWLLATAQHFQLSGDEVASLVRAEVPAPVLQAMMSTAPAYQLGVGVDASGRSTDDYLNSPGVAAGSPPTTMTMTTMTPVPTQTVNVYDNSCCAPPVYSAYNYYSPPLGFSSYYGPFVSYYSPYVHYRYPRSFPVRPSTHHVNPRPAYSSNPVGVRAGQAVSSPPRAMPSRRRP
jgi:hypothetical protein